MDEFECTDIWFGETVGAEQYCFDPCFLWSTEKRRYRYDITPVLPGYGPLVHHDMENDLLQLGDMDRETKTTHECGSSRYFGTPIQTFLQVSTLISSYVDVFCLLYWKYWPSFIFANNVKCYSKITIAWFYLLKEDQKTLKVNFSPFCDIQRIHNDSVRRAVSRIR